MIPELTAVFLILITGSAASIHPSLRGLVLPSQPHAFCFHLDLPLLSSEAGIPQAPRPSAPEGHGGLVGLDFISCGPKVGRDPEPPGF